MTYYIRTSENRTLVDIELYVKTDKDSPIESIGNVQQYRKYIELSSRVQIYEYSKLLVAQPKFTQETLIKDFNELSQLRGWLWENYFMGRDNDANEILFVRKALMDILREIATKYDLYIVTD